MHEKPTYKELEHRIQKLEQAELERDREIDALREIKIQNKSLFHAIQAAIVVHDAETKFIVCNFKAQGLLGVSEDHLL